jgi:hypothetical protein
MTFGCDGQRYCTTLGKHQLNVLIKNKAGLFGHEFLGGKMVKKYF